LKDKKRKIEESGREKGTRKNGKVEMYRIVKSFISY
jgi:hypothetical protein